MTIFCVGVYLFFRAVASRVFSARVSLTAVFGMGTGGPSAIKTLTERNSTDTEKRYRPFLIGAPSGIRTRDPLIKSQLLYQLS